MKVAIIGSGGREDAILQSLSKSPKITKLYAIPGNAGMENLATCVPIGVKELEKIVSYCVAEHMDFVVVAPDDPLVLGLVDRLEAAGIRCFGPRKNAAILEGSKVFAKNLMQQYGIPTAAYAVFENMQEALAYVRKAKLPLVVKADGLALGKGVVICQTSEEAEQAVLEMMEKRVFGVSGSRVVIEEYLTGPEVSVLAFTDGKTLVPMISSMDHKRAGDGDTGLNTGGMGTVAPNPYYTKEIADNCMETIFLPTIRAMAAEGRPFSGCLYFGLMLTVAGPRVIEYNCRFGDPETQVVLPLLETDLFTILQAVTEQKLDTVPIRFSSQSACCVILTSCGYPQKYETGYPITLPTSLPDHTMLFCAGVKRNAEGDMVTAGGRVVGVTAVADSLEKAIHQAYDVTDKISFKGKTMRHDIGKRALAAGKEHQYQYGESTYGI